MNREVMCLGSHRWESRRDIRMRTQSSFRIQHWIFVIPGKARKQWVDRSGLPAWKGVVLDSHTMNFRLPHTKLSNSWWHHGDRSLTWLTLFQRLAHQKFWGLVVPFYSSASNKPVSYCLWHMSVLSHLPQSRRKRLNLRGCGLYC